MSPHYDRHADSSAPQNDLSEPTGGLDDAAIEGAADALRQADLESAQEESQASAADSSKLDDMSMDELRALAQQLDVPDRGKIIDRDELVAAIRRRM
jgi:hypothetical protein